MNEKIVRIDRKPKVFSVETVFTIGDKTLSDVVQTASTDGLIESLGDLLGSYDLCEIGRISISIHG